MLNYNHMEDIKFIHISRKLNVSSFINVNRSSGEALEGYRFLYLVQQFVKK
jgi:hypothetical protein